MEAKEKANEIYNNMLEWVKDSYKFKEMDIISITAKQCALICGDEILEQLDIISHIEEMYMYWQEVKLEINKL